MKRVRDLYQEIISIPNLRLADWSARRGKRDTYGVKLHDRNKEENIRRLHQQLKDKSFRNSEYETFKIYEPKERLIFRLPYYPDRIVHHAIMNIMEPVWTKVFTADTYSCIKGRGIHAIIPKMKAALTNESTKYCLKIDIRKFYPSIDHNVLKEIVRRKIKDDDLLWLLDEIIDSAPGVPIGNYLSQYFSNLYLAYFDHFVKEELKVKYYFRYADDMVFLSDQKSELWDVFEMTKIFMRNLKLEIKENYRVFPVEKGIDFVGYVFYPTHTLLRKSIKQNMFRRIKQFKNNPKKLNESLAAYNGWMKHCNSYNLRKKVYHEIEQNQSATTDRREFRYRQKLLQF